MKKLMKLEEVMHLTGLSKSSIYQFIADEKFPAQVKIGGRSVAWIQEEVIDWIECQIEVRNSDIYAYGWV